MYSPYWFFHHGSGQGRARGLQLERTVTSGTFLHENMFFTEYLVWNMLFMLWLLLKLCCFIMTVIVRLKSSVLLWLRCLRCHSSKIALLKFHLLLPKLHVGICGDLYIAYVLICGFGTVKCLIYICICESTTIMHPDKLCIIQEV